MIIKLVPEENEERWRMVSILTYLVVLLGFGLPIWWATTRVYRAPLPLEEMLELRPTPMPPLQVFVNAATEEKTRAMITEMRNVLGTTVTLSPYNGPIPNLSPSTFNNIPTDNIPPGSLLLLESPTSPHGISFSHHRTILFRPEIPATRLARMLQAWPGVRADTALMSGGANTKGVDRNAEKSGDSKETKAFPAAGAYDVMVTVVENDGGRLDWDIVEAIEEYISPFLESLSSIANFTVKSSWLQYASLGLRARRVGPAGALAEALLAHGVAPLESRLAGHVATRPQVHLVLYVPSCDDAPLHIYTKEGVRSPVGAFISPRWGGVQILNPECNEEATWSVKDPARVMATAVTQLARLLGVPAVPRGADMVTGGSTTHAAWQLDWMLRARTSEYLDAARLTLRSLAQLLSEISNIVIRDEVAASVHSGVAAAAAAQRHLADGHVTAACARAQQAAEDAEAAFTDPTLLALLYFPDDQKYAVYIPLFLPIMIPVIMSMRQLIAYIKKPKIAETCL